MVEYNPRASIFGKIIILNCSEFGEEEPVVQCNKIYSRFRFSGSFDYVEKGSVADASSQEFDQNCLMAWSPKTIFSSFVTGTTGQSWSSRLVVVSSSTSNT